MLASAGFRCYPVMADMKRPNIHCALVVEMNERRYLVDPGYLVGEPVELAGKPVRIETTFGVVEIRPRQGERYDLFTLEGDDRKWRYTAKTAAVSHAAFMRYWQDSFSLPMMNNLLLTRLTPQGHLYIKNHHLRMKGAGGKTNENIRSGFEARIAADFGIPPEVTAQAREHLEQAEAYVARAGSPGAGKGVGVHGAPESRKAESGSPGEAPRRRSRGARLRSRASPLPDARGTLRENRSPRRGPPLRRDRLLRGRDGPLALSRFVDLLRAALRGDRYRSGEARYRGDRGGSVGEGGRRVNIDPGYMDYYKIILASFKEGPQKVYLGEGVYADPILLFFEGEYGPLPWTFPDFKSGLYRDDFREIRALYKKARRGES